MKIPDKGIGKDEVFAKLEEFRKDDLNWRTGRVWAYTYDAGKDIEEVGKRAYLEFLSENALDPTVFPSMLRMENEIVAMAAAHVKGDANTAGNFTSGGTESIILAVKTARDFARATRPHIAQPEMILPDTAHAAFTKAEAYLGVKAVRVPVTPETFRADVDAIRNAITDNTILLVGSAPQYAHGVIDPIEEIGALAAERDLLFHVDACMGGFLLPWFRRLGEPVPRFEFDVPGVTSLSMDLHKYAFCPKGASLVLYKSKDLRRHQIFTCASWTGYTMVNTTVQSTKSGGALAAAWAVLNYVGEERYLEIARHQLQATRRVAAGVREIPGLRVLGEPEMNLVSFTSDEANVFVIIDEMKARGWYVQPQLAFANSKENIHLSISMQNVAHADAMLADLAGAVEAAKTHPPIDVSGLAGILDGVLANDLTPEMYANLLGAAGITGAALPERLAEINTIMNALPPKLRERLLREFVNDLFTPATE
ncbi:aspartate aminotransferase family protein [bacterium]|nr:aspartate aminotransferase family protein [bacterium]